MNSRLTVASPSARGSSAVPAPLAGDQRHRSEQKDQISRIDGTWRIRGTPAGTARSWHRCRSVQNHRGIGHHGVNGYGDIQVLPLHHRSTAPLEKPLDLASHPERSRLVGAKFHIYMLVLPRVDCVVRIALTGAAFGKTVSAEFHPGRNSQQELGRHGWFGHGIDYRKVQVDLLTYGYAGL